MVMVKTISKEFQNVRFDLFLDRAKVQNAVDRKSRRVLSRTGGFVRQAVRRSMKKKPKKKIVRTGPPRWVKRGLKDNIFFFYDDRKKSVIIGPRPFKQTRTAVPTRRRSGASLLEYGGGAKVRILNRHGKPWVKTTFRQRSFMAPQMDAAQAKLKENLANVKFGR